MTADENAEGAATHDYTTPPEWGRAISFKVDPLDRNIIKGHLFSRGVVRVGDFLLVPNGQGVGRGRITQVHRPADPGDMFFFTAERVADAGVTP